MTEVFYQTDVGDAKLKQMAEASRDLAKKAIKQHGIAIGEAVKVIEDILGEVGPNLVATSGHGWGVVTARIPHEREELFRTQVCAAKQIGAHELGNKAFEIDVVTEKVVKESKPDNYFVGYATSGKAYYPDDDDMGNDTTDIYGDVIKPMLCGEIV